MTLFKQKASNTGKTANALAEILKNTQWTGEDIIIHFIGWTCVTLDRFNYSNELLNSTISWLCFCYLSDCIKVVNRIFVDICYDAFCLKAGLFSKLHSQQYGHLYFYRYRNYMTSTPDPLFTMPFLCICTRKLLDFSEPAQWVS